MKNMIACACFWPVLVALVASALIGPVAARAAERPPNIVLLLADDVAYDDVGCYGSKLLRTPHIDRLAAEGRKFTSFYAPSAVCTPTRAAIMTGCYAPRVGLASVLYPQANIGLNPNEITVAELLQSRGYATACIGKWHLGHLPEFMPNNHGFDYFFGLPYPNDHGPERPNRDNPPIPLYRNEAVVEQPVDLPPLNDRLVEESKKFIDENRDRPFFLYVPFIGAHTPWFVAERFRGQSKLGPYGDAVEEVDWGVGEIMAYLKEQGLDENTLVVFASDNGPLWKPHAGLEEIYGDAGRLLPQEHLLAEGKYSTTEGGVRVPMIARWPGVVPPGSVCDELAAGFDFYPTFAELAGAEVPSDRIVDGKDVMPLIAEDDAKSPHEAFFYFSNYDLEAVRSGPWKLRLVDHSSVGSRAKNKPGTSLYNLQDDVGETQNVADQHPEVVARLKKLLKECRQDIGDGPKRPGKNRREPGKVGGAPPRSE